MAAVPLARLELTAARYLRGTTVAAADDAIAVLVDNHLTARIDAENVDALGAVTESRRTALMVACAEAWMAADATNVM